MYVYNIKCKLADTRFQLISVLYIYVQVAKEVVRRTHTHTRIYIYTNGLISHDQIDAKIWQVDLFLFKCLLK